MSKKTLIQVILIILIILISFFIINNYYKGTKTLKSSKEIQFKDTKSNDTNNDIIENIKYTSNNSNGDVFEILAKYGEPSKELKNLMFLTNVKANVILKNKTNIKLTSDYANFNTKTFETTFIDNVQILRNDETILGNQVYLVFDQTEDVLKKNSNVDQNLIRISQDVLIKKPGYMLKADILEIDLVTKNMKIYMNDKKNKIEAKSKLKQ